MKYINISQYQRNKYHKILEVVFRNCRTFEIVDLYAESIISDFEFHQDLLDAKKSSRWNGTTMIGQKAIIYIFNLSRASMNFFRRKDSFFEDHKDGYYHNTGMDSQYDIAFLEEKPNDCLLYTITHEGEVFIREDLFNNIL